VSPQTQGGPTKINFVPPPERNPDGWRSGKKQPIHLRLSTKTNPDESKKVEIFHFCGASKSDLDKGGKLEVAVIFSYFLLSRFIVQVLIHIHNSIESRKGLNLLLWPAASSSWAWEAKIEIICRKNEEEGNHYSVGIALPIIWQPIFNCSQ
jgi:hypothetical protein